MNFLPQIKTYPAMQFEGRTIQFINTYFFEAQAKDEDHYKYIVNIFYASIFFPWGTFVVFSYLPIFLSKWIRTRTTSYIKGKTRRSVNTEHDEYIEIHGNTDNLIDQKEEKKQIRRTIILSLIVVSGFLDIALFTFQIIASVKLIQYGNEVLHIGDNRMLPILYTVFSIFTTVFLISTTLFYCFKIAREYNRSPDVDDTLGSLLQVFLRSTFIYLGYYFSPFMLLAFINDPIQTAFIYMMEISFIFCIYLLTYGICAIKIKRQRNSRLALGSGVAITYFLIILYYLLSLGNFHDIQGVQNLSLPLFIGLLSLFVFPPFINRIENILEVGTTSERMQQISEDENQQVEGDNNINLTDDGN